MIRLLIRCYPARWRARYGAEFEALLAEHPLGPFDVADTLLGALDAHLHFRGSGSAADANGFGMSFRVGGYAALWTGILWLFVLLGWSTLFVNAGTIALVAAMIGLNAAQEGRGSWLAWVPVALGAVSVVAWFLGGYWWLPALTLVWLGSAMFSVGLLRARILSRRMAALIIAGSALGTAVTVVLFTAYALGLLTLWFEGGGYLLLAVSLILFAIGWIGVGLDVLLRLPPSVKPVSSGKPVA